ncbi:MAG: hypothetical protein GC204_02290 [Chloroflexi bacterium]|nr:hypothetical protein [Chloroflexota bacterium]
MPQVEQSIDIQASPAVVFALIADQPERISEWWPAFELQQRVTPPPTAVGSVARYTYNMMGIRIKGEHQVLQIEEGHHLVVRTLSGIDSMFDFSLAEIDGATHLTVQVAYSLPGSMLGQSLNRHKIEQKNERDLDQSLHNLKLLLETEARI